MDNTVKPKAKEIGVERDIGIQVGHEKRLAISMFT